jgi:hypothetical protein
MKSQGEAPFLFTEFQMATTKFCGEKICFLHVNNALELIHGELNSRCKQQGILYKKTVPNFLLQNGVAKWTNLTIYSMAHAMLIDANLHNYFWPFAVLTATHIKQQLPHLSLPSNVTPFKLWFKRQADLSHLRPFSAKCTSHIISTHPSKFQPCGEPCHFLGYAKDAKGYLVWVTNPNNNGGTLKV